VTASRDALIERLCERMHRAYEDAAVVEGWATQEASRKPWADVPAANQRTVRASVEAALALLEAEGWGDIRSATDALDARCQQQADALRQLGHDPAGEIVSAARHRAVVTQLEATIASLRAGADHSRCRHHDDVCSAIVDANEAMGEALIAERAEVKRLKDERDAAPRQTLLAFADRLDGEIIPDQDGCVAFARDVAEEYPGGAYSGEPEFRAENAHLTEEVEKLQNLLGELSLYVRWRYCTMQLITNQREVWAQAVEAWERDIHRDDPRTLAELHHADRWWLCPTCGPRADSGPDDGPHDHCQWAVSTEKEVSP
jgi:hypothetical protein